MKQFNSLLKMMVLMFLASSLYAGATIGTVYGKHKYKVYIGTGNGIYLENKSSGKVCDTRLINRGKYVSTPSGKALYNKNEVLTEIRRRLYLSKIKGCK